MMKEIYNIYITLLQCNTCIATINLIQFQNDTNYRIIIQFLNKFKLLVK